MDYKPVGGVRRVSLRAADTVVRAMESVEVELIDDGSTYREVLSVERGSGVVRHTLTLKALYSNAEAWLQSEFIDMATRTGVVAEVMLNDSRQVTVGFSEALGVEQPLRIKSLEVDSAHSPSEVPTVTLVLCCEGVNLI